MSRKDLTLADKIALLDKLKSQAPSTSYRNLERIINVPKSTIVRVKSQEVKLREEWGKGQDKSRKRKREGKDPDVDEALNQWFSIVTGRGVRVSGPMLKAKSEELAAKLGHVNFNATDGWLSRWKTRHKIKFKKAHGEKANADSWNFDQWKLYKLPELLQLWNADETGLFYRATPDGSLSYKHHELIGSKKAMERVPNHEEFLSIDSDLQCHCEYEDVKDAIIEEIAQKSNAEEDPGSDVEIDEPVPVRVTTREARQHLLELRRYFMQDGSEGSPLSALDDCDDFINLQSNKNIRQGTIEKYLGH